MSSLFTFTVLLLWNAFAQVTPGYNIDALAGGQGSYYDGNAGTGCSSFDATFAEIGSSAYDKTTGNLYLIDRKSIRVLNMTSGNMVRTFKNLLSPAEDDFYYPIGLWVRNDGMVLFCKSAIFSGFGWSGSLVLLDPQTGAMSDIVAVNHDSNIGDGGLALGAVLDHPVATTSDAMNNIFISDFNANRIRRIDGTTGIITTIVGNGVTTFNGDGAGVSTQIRQPLGLAVRADGALLYFCEGSYVRVWDAVTENVTTIAGLFPGPTSGNGGPALKARMNKPSGLYLNETLGWLFVYDVTQIRIIDLNTGNITLVAGSANSNPRGVSTGDGGPALNAVFRAQASIFADLIRSSQLSSDGKGSIFFSDSAVGPPTFPRYRVLYPASLTCEGECTISPGECFNSTGVCITGRCVYPPLAFNSPCSTGVCDTCGNCASADLRLRLYDRYNEVTPNMASGQVSTARMFVDNLGLGASGSPVVVKFTNVPQGITVSGMRSDDNMIYTWLPDLWNGSASSGLVYGGPVFAQFSSTPFLFQVAIADVVPSPWLNLSMTVSYPFDTDPSNNNFTFAFYVTPAPRWRCAFNKLPGNTIVLGTRTNVSFTCQNVGAVASFGVMSGYIHEDFSRVDIDRHFTSGQTDVTCDSAFIGCVCSDVIAPGANFSIGAVVDIESNVNLANGAILRLLGDVPIQSGGSDNRMGGAGSPVKSDELMGGTLFYDVTIVPPTSSSSAAGTGSSSAGSSSAPNFGTTSTATRVASVAHLFLLVVTAMVFVY